MEKLSGKLFEGGWHKGVGHCGEGSNEEHCLPSVNSVIAIIETLKSSGELKGVPVLTEAGCGDMRWFRHVPAYFANAVDYKGYDLNDWGSEHYQKNGGPFAFEQADITTQVLRPSDVILTRLVFIHLSNERILSALALFRETGAKFLIADHRNCDNRNRHKTDGGKQGFDYDLTAQPFGLNIMLTPKNSSLALYAL